jgi:hypothetical protein
MRIMLTRLLLTVLLAGLPTARALAAEAWVQIEAPGAACADGSPWHFYYRMANPARLAIWFDAGGTCWDAATCAHAITHLSTAALPGDGIFDATRPDNPLHDFSIVLLPGCTADAHIGRRTVTYERPDGGRANFAHQGARNTEAALDYLTTQRVRPTTLLVGGESVGAIAAGFWAAEIGDRWADAQLVVLGDAAGGYRTRGANAALRQWGVLDALPEANAYIDPTRVFFETFYIAAGELHPRARLGQVNHANDAFQRRTLDALGTNVAQLAKPMQCNMNEVRINTPGFHSFMVPGTQHELLTTNAIYQARCEAQSLLAWVDDLIAGRDVETHWCDGTLALHTSRDPPPL